MKHLTTDEIISFVTIDNISNETLEFAASVNHHILLCDECREKVTAFQTVYDGLLGQLTKPAIEKVLKNIDLEK